MCCSRRSPTFFKRLSFLFLFLSLLFIVIGIVGPILIHSLLQSQASSSVVMTPSSFSLWGMIPGSSHMNITRKFNFFEFLNPYQVLFLNETPIFVESEAYFYQEYQNFTNSSFTEDENGEEIVEFQYWEYMKELGGEGGKEAQKEKKKLVNLAAFGAWTQLLGTEESIFALQTMGQLISKSTFFFSNFS
jgi:CD36 family